jgi:outer membrane receptor for ferrienterochelin and colicin
MFIWDNDNDFYLNLQGKKGKKVADKKEKKSEHTHSTKKTIKAKKGKTHKALVVSHSNSEWTADQKSLAKKYEKLTNQKLEPGTNGKIKYKIKGKNTYQQRTWAEIKKFVDYKTSKK